MEGSRTDRGAATRARVLESAWCILREKGVEAVTIRAVARDADIAASVVLHHFRSRAELVDACIELPYAELRRLSGAFLDMLEAEPSLARAIERAARIGFRFARQHQPTLRALHGDVIARGGLDEARRSSLQLPFFAAFRARVPGLAAMGDVELRMRVQTVVFAAARWALSGDGELMALTGASDVEAAEALTEEHVVRIAVMLLVP